MIFNLKATYHGQENNYSSAFYENWRPQPETWDPEAINKYFIGNFAKQWAMCDGYLPTYLVYENGVIRFKLVTDPRITDIYWISLCNYIANQYKAKVGLLKDATNFDVEHYMANDIIGFNIAADNPEIFNEYYTMLKASYATLPKNPNLLHKGRIR